MVLIPADTEANWPAPNYTNPVRREHEPFIIVTSVFLFAATVSVGLRLWTRIFVRRWFGPDDLLIVIAWFLTVGVSATVSYATARLGWDRHLWDFPIQHYEASAKLLYVSRIFWGLTSSIVRLSVLCLYYRLVRFCKAPRYFYWTLHCMTAITVLMLLYYFLVGLIPCIPIHAYWTWPIMPDAKYYDDSKSVKAAAIINTLSELVLAALPLLAVFPLRISKRERWTATSLLSLGFVVALAGCFRTYFIFKMLNSTYDLTWWSVPHWICAQIEIDLALICACASPMRPLVLRIARRLGRVKSLSKLSHMVRTNSTSQNNGSSVSVHTTRDLEATAEWSKIVSRAIDLDGIANDGLGYTVTISGPTRERRKLRKRHGEFTAPSQKQSVRGLWQDGPKPLEIPMKTEVSVSESWHEGPLGERALFWNPPDSSEYMTFANFEAGMGQGDLEFLGNTSIHNDAVPESAEIERTRNDDSNGLGELKISSM